MDSHEQRMAKALQEAEASMKKEQQEAMRPAKVHLSEEDERTARETITLLDDPRFKAYLELENNLFVAHYENAYKDPRLVQAGCMPENATFGELMAYQNGFRNGMLAMRTKTAIIWKILKTNEKNERE